MMVVEQNRSAELRKGKLLYMMCRVDFVAPIYTVGII